MAYGSSSSLPFEGASKLGHLTVIQDPLVNQMLESFQRVQPEHELNRIVQEATTLVDLSAKSSIDFVIAFDGSISTVPNTLAQHKTLSYLKLASLCISLQDLAETQRPIVNPDRITEILSRNSDTYSTVLPLSNVKVPGMSQFETIRHVLKVTFEQIANGGLYDTLDFLVSQTWAENQQYEPHFNCHSCGQFVVVPRHEHEFQCLTCGERLTLVDYLGLLMEVHEDSNDDAVARSLMQVLEHLMAIYYLRQLVDRGPEFTKRVLFLKDGPLMLPGQFSRLVEPIREYLQHLNRSGVAFHLAGVEKTGAFVTHLEEIKESLRTPGSVFIPSNEYILSRIKHSGSDRTQYGERVLYGVKLYYSIDERNTLVLNVPANGYTVNARPDDLIGFSAIAQLLPKLHSRQFQNALLPIVAVNKIASMSYYPSNNILERFTEHLLGRNEIAKGQ